MTEPSQSHGDDHGHGEHDEHGIGHVMPLSVLFTTFGALILFTIITMATTYMKLGTAEIWVSMGIATVKASLVLLYFMHLRYDRPFNAFTFVFTLIFVGLFLGGALTDSWQYQDDIEAEEMQQEVTQPTPAAEATADA